MVIAGTAAMLIVAMTTPDERPLHSTVIACGLGLILAAAGLLDDIRPLHARYRFGIQLMIVCLLLWALGPTTLPAFGVLTGIMLVLLLLAVGIWWINLYNFMDGIDGIAATQAICMLTGSAMICLLNGGGPTYTAGLWQFMALIIAAAAGFLILNWSPASIFMGDVGSTWLAFILLFIALVSIQTGWLHYETWMILGALFITDASVTLLRRMLTGQRWHEAHRNHAYQHLSRRIQKQQEHLGNSASVARSIGHRWVNGLLITINTLWLLPLALITVLQPHWALLTVLVAYVPLIAGALILRAGQA